MDPHVASPSLWRGIRWAFLCASIGFVLPNIVLGGIPFFRHIVFGYSRIEMEADWNSLRRDFLPPSIGIAMVFGLAALMNFTPARRIGFIRALLCMGGVTLLSDFVCGIVTAVYHLGPQTYTSDPWLWLRTLIAVSLPISFCAVYVAVQYFYFYRSKSTAS